ncbi:M48 family metallopeptidase [Cohaesibacter intestini]|uniref:M48 family metallopeptidase n=1 Tax=Cohaesibacter intestini TaxID=2211145 RepID=UPI000DEA53E0|nr:SprT family zinc-dependent metalloprotease [Cohaesibacter intestini]
MAASDQTEPENRLLVYGDMRLPYVVVREERPSGKIAINVEPDGTVLVQAPVAANASAIHQSVHAKARWIFQHVVNAQSRFHNVLNREYVNGEEVMYLGRRHQLKLIDVPRSERRVRLFRGRVEVLTETRDPDAIRLKLRAWYKFRAQDIFKGCIREWTQTLPWINTPPKFELLEMQKRWGSCATDGVLRINPFLVKAPRVCIEHVLLHELCHLKEHNHSKAFYELLDRFQPGWQTTKTKLDEWVEELLNE